MRAPNVPRCVGCGVSVAAAVRTRAPVFALARPMCACHSVVEHLVPPRSLAAREEVARFAAVQHDFIYCQEPRTGHSRPKIPRRQENQCGVCPLFCRPNATPHKVRRTAERPRTPTGTLNIVHRVYIFPTWRSCPKRPRGLEKQVQKSVVGQAPHHHHHRLCTLQTTTPTCVKPRTPQHEDGVYSGSPCLATHLCTRRAHDTAGTT